MNVYPRDDKQAIHVDSIAVNKDGTIDLQEAHKLYDGLYQALTECGAKITLTVEIPGPTDAQIAQAVHRVAHLRRSFDATPWNDAKANMELVTRVLTACR